MDLPRRFIFCLLVISMALGNLYKISLFSPDVRISLLDLTVFGFTVLFILKNISGLDGFYKANKTVLKPLLLFSLIAFTSLVLSFFRFGTMPFLVGGMYLARFVFLGIFYVCLKQTFTKNQLLQLLFALGLTVLISGLGQYLFSPDVRSLEVSEWDPHYFRVVGTLLDPGFTGELLLLFLIFLITRPPVGRKLNLILIFLSYIAFSLTYSRSSFLAAYGAVFLFSYTRKSWKIIIFGIVLLSATLFLLPRAPGGEGVKLERTSSIQARILNWKNSLTIIAGNPVLGVGFNTYRYAQKDYGFLDTDKWLKSHAGAGADSSLLFTAATTGIIGLVCYLLYLRSLWSLGKGDNTLKLGLVTLLIHSVFLNSLFYPFILVWVSLLAAVAAKDYK